MSQHSAHEHHKQAAKHHELAAKHHHEAAANHEKMTTKLPAITHISPTAIMCKPNTMPTRLLKLKPRRTLNKVPRFGIWMRTGPRGPVLVSARA
jgi:hypothetical protein